MQLTTQPGFCHSKRKKHVILVKITQAKKRRHFFNAQNNQILLFLDGETLPNGDQDDSIISETPQVIITFFLSFISLLAKINCFSTLFLFFSSPFP